MISDDNSSVSTDMIGSCIPATTSFDIPGGQLSCTKENETSFQEDELNTSMPAGTLFSSKVTSAPKREDSIDEQVKFYFHIF